MYEELVASTIQKYLILLNAKDDPQDLIQEYYCRRLEGRDKTQSIKQFIIDYLRIESGRKDSKSYDHKLNLINYIEVSKITAHDKKCNFAWVSACIDLKQIKSDYPYYEELLDLLILGYTHTEIAELVKCDVSNVGFHFRNLKKRVISGT